MRKSCSSRVGSDAHAHALELVCKGPPVDLAARCFARHAIYLSTVEVIFVVEAAAEAEWRVDDLLSDWREHDFRDALAAWRPLVEAPPRLAGEE